MSLELTPDFLLWCTLINFGILLMWFMWFVFAHDWVLEFHGKWFRLSREQFDAIHYAGWPSLKQEFGYSTLCPCWCYTSSADAIFQLK